MKERASTQPGGWRKSYSHVFELSALGCAWEFLRRNPKFREEWNARRPARQAFAGPNGLNVVGVSAPADGPCLWLSSVDEDATAASVFWDPAATGRVLDVVAVPPKAAFRCHVFDPEFADVEKTLLVLPDGRQQLLLRDGTRTLQLNITGQSLLEPVALVVGAGQPDAQSQTQTQLLKCFRMLRTSGALPRECFAPHPYAKRAARVLMALDGYLAGAPHREIAVVIFGLERVKRDWSDPGEHLRDTVRRAIARGLILMNGGYRTFLC